MSNLPNYQEGRITLTDVREVLECYVGDNSIINVNETLRLLLGQFFYGETPTTIFPVTNDCERTIVWPVTGQTLFGSVLVDAMNNLGGVFWSVADKITNQLLTVRADYQHRPEVCFYKFFPDTCLLVVYVPVIPGVMGEHNLMQLAGPAVVTVCAETLPSYYRV